MKDLTGEFTLRNVRGPGPTCEKLGSKSGASFTRALLWMRTLVLVGVAVPGGSK